MCWTPWTDSLLHHEKKTSRWPMVIYNMWDIGALNAYIGWTFLNPDRVATSQKSQTMNISDEAGLGTFWTWKSKIPFPFFNMHGIQLHCQVSQQRCCFVYPRSNDKKLDSFGCYVIFSHRIHTKLVCDFCARQL